MTVIQHSTQSLRHQAIQRYLRTRSRIDRRFRRTLLRMAATLLLALAPLCVLALIAIHQRRAHL